MAQSWDGPGGPGSGQAAGLLALCVVGNVVAAICVYMAGGDSWMTDVPWSARSRRSWPAVPTAGREAWDPAGGPGAAAAPPSGGAAEAEGPEATGGEGAGAAAAAEAGAGGAGAGAGGHAPPEAASGEGADAVVAAPEAAAAGAGGAGGAAPFAAAVAVPAEAGGRPTADDAEPPAGGKGRKRSPGKCEEQVINHRVRNRACLEKYRELMLAMAKEPGIDMIFGANDGVQFEPAIYIGYWKRVAHHTRVLVEPVPPLFAKLQKNLANLSTPPIFINKAVKMAASSEFLDLYCWDTAMVDEWVLTGQTSLPKEVRRPEGYWNALCSTEKQQLFGRAHVLDTDMYRGLRSEDKQRVLSEVEAFVQLHHVPAATPEEMVMEVAARKGDASLINYVQVDVEALDKYIVLALPFGQNGFLPKVVLWEGCYADQEFELLTKHGYESCCCVNIYGANTLAYQP